MTIEEYLETNGIDVCFPIIRKWNCVDVGFINSDGKEDETEFDVENMSYDGLEDLIDLFEEFCEENGFDNDKVLYVTIVATADTYEELLAIT